MNLHVGCGSVYLNGWLNVDLPLPNVFLASERPDLVERYRTTEDQYYARHETKGVDSFRSGALLQETACDAFGSFGFLPAKADNVDELLARQCFEHLDRHESHEALTECFRVLGSGGLLRLDIPDPDETLRLYQRTGDEFYVRHLFGPRLNEFGYHTHYRRDMLIDLAMRHGFTFVGEEVNIHCYPAYCLRFQKP
jgi:SAM-dependent methyltransferase